MTWRGKRRKSVGTRNPASVELDGRQGSSRSEVPLFRREPEDFMSCGTGFGFRDPRIKWLCAVILRENAVRVLKCCQSALDKVCILEDSCQCL